MTDDRDPLERRLREALPDDVPDETRARHLASIDGALRPRTARLGWRHRLGTALAAAAAALTPVGVAVAAEGAIPGDVLYPVKQVTEQVQALVRDEVVLAHRVDELDALLDRPTTDEDTLVTAVERGVDAALDQPDEPELQERMSGLALEAATRVRDTSRLALDRLPTRQRTDRTQVGPSAPASPRPSQTVRPSPRPSDRPAGATDQPTASPSHDPGTTHASDGPSPSDAPSPRPSRSPLPPEQPGPSPSPDPSPRPDPSPTPDPAPQPEPSPDPQPRPTADDRQPTRTERHEARDAGLVFIDVYADGIRLAGVRPNDGWEHRVDRSNEPEALTVRFLRGDRRVVLTARWVNGEVRVAVEEARPTD